MSNGLAGAHHCVCDHLPGLQRIALLSLLSSFFEVINSSWDKIRIFKALKVRYRLLREKCQHNSVKLGS